MNKQAFRAGFCYGLAEKGLTPSEFESKLEKQAILGPAMGVLGRMGSSVLGWAPWIGAAGLLGAKGLGTGAGRAYQTLTEPTETDIEIEKKEEEAEEYKRLTEEARLRAAERALRTKPGV